MAKFEKRLQAHKLRRKGNSIKDIALELSVAKSTVSLWCRDLKLTAAQQLRLRRKQIAAGNKGRMIGAQRNKERKERTIAQAESEAAQLVGELSERDKLLLGIGLYWGEGVKADTSSGAALVNSDPDVLRTMQNWFRTLGVQKADFNPYVYISEIHRSRKETIISFWSKELQLPQKQFAHVIFLSGRPKKIYENHDSYYGVVALRIRRSSYLKYKILGLIKACK